VSESTGGTARPQFAIFRAKDARFGAETSLMEYEGMTSVVADGAQRATEAGADEGHELRPLFVMPGFSLVYVWFKSDFPLPRHSHNVDCLYYIVGGSLTIGQEELGVGDGFFVGKEVPYTYRPGPAGVEVLEFRAADSFNIKIMANNPAFWDKAVESVRNQRSAWAKEARPALVMQSPGHAAPSVG
jgi:hypothetical protein